MGLDMTLYCSIEDGELVEVMYWRKFNALHNWFRQFFDDPTDDNGVEAPVPRSALVQLLEDITSSVVLNKPILEPVEGFFFGSNTKDEYYHECCKTLVTELGECLGNNSNQVFYYETSY